MSKILAITNQKGGVGKTSTALNLGAALTIAGKRTLLVDNDPQGNLTAALGYTPAEQARTLANLLLAAIDYPEELEPHLQRTILRTDSGLDLIPANRRLADAAARLQVMQLAQYNAVGDVERACEKVMAALLEPLKPHYDYIIIDCGLKHELLTMYQSRPQLCQSVKTSVAQVYGGSFHVFQRPIEYSIKVAEHTSVSFPL